jgi:hypothetical protein
MGAVRHFCGRCASPIFNFSPVLEMGGLVTQSLDGAQPAPWVHVNLESKAPWLVIADGLPRFPAWPSPDELRELLRAHPGAGRRAAFSSRPSRDAPRPRESRAV